MGSSTLFMTWSDYPKLLSPIMSASSAHSALFSTQDVKHMLSHCLTQYNLSLGKVTKGLTGITSSTCGLPQLAPSFPPYQPLPHHTHRVGGKEGESASNFLAGWAVNDCSPTPLCTLMSWVRVCVCMLIVGSRKQITIFSTTLVFTWLWIQFYLFLLERC